MSGLVLSVYNAVSELPSGAANGTMAWIAGSTNRLYISNGTGWYSTTLTNPNAPVISSVTDASANTTPFTLATDGTPTVITVTATDADGTPLTYSYTVTSGTLGTTATISQADNVFTITPSTTEADAGTFGLTFIATDGVQDATSVADFSLQFVGDYDRAIFSGGSSSSGGTTPIEYVSISTGADTTSFGSLTTPRGHHASTGNANRALFIGGEVSASSPGSVTAYTNTWEYVVPATLGNSISFGTGQEFAGNDACADETRALNSGGRNNLLSSYSSSILYATIDTASNASGFGSISGGQTTGHSMASDGTYAYLVGTGNITPNTYQTTIERVVIQTTGSSSSYSNLSSAGYYQAAEGNSDIVVVAGGITAAGGTGANSIETFSTSSGATAQVIGQLTQGRYSLASANDGTTILYAGGYAGSMYNIIDYTIFATPGNATDFGDLLTARYRLKGTSGSPA